MGGHEGVVQKLLAVGTDKDATDDVRGKRGADRGGCGATPRLSCYPVFLVAFGFSPKDLRLL